MLALAGRECAIFNHHDSAPVTFLQICDMAVRILSISLIPSHCDLLLNTTEQSEHAPQQKKPSVLIPMASLAFVAAALLTLLQELWRMWEPFHSGTNTQAWACCIAHEIDCILGEFDETEKPVRVRVPAFASDWCFASDGMATTTATTASHATGSGDHTLQLPSLHTV